MLGLANRHELQIIPEQGVQLPDHLPPVPHLYPQKTNYVVFLEVELPLETDRKQTVA